MAKATPTVDLPVGTRVRYHGSQERAHGEYRFEGPCTCHQMPGYDDERCGLEDRYQLVRDRPRTRLLHVHGGSFTPTSATEGRD